MEAVGTAKVNRLSEMQNGDISLQASDEANAFFDELSKSDKKPWGNCSLDGLDVGTSIAELKANENVNFPVKRVKLVDEETGEQFFNNTVLKNVTNGRHLGMVTPRFNILENEETLNWITPFVESGQAMFESYTQFRGGARCMLMVRMAQQPLFALPNDPILPYLAFSWGFDGQTPIQIFPTAIRLWCKNQMSAIGRDARAYGIKIRHRSGMRDALDLVQDVTMQAYAGMKDVEEILMQLANKPVNQKSLETYFKKVLKLPFDSPQEIVKRNKEFETVMEKNSRSLNQLFRAFEEERETMPAAGENTFYHAYNAVTRHVSHNIAARSGEYRLASSMFGDGRAMREVALNEAISA